MNSIFKDLQFQKTKLFQEFNKQPLGFVDVGARGGIHSTVHSIAGLTEVLCFEVDSRDVELIESQYKREYDFSRVVVLERALASRAGRRKFYVTKAPLNTSFLEPNAHFINRYKAHKFKVVKSFPVSTKTLDSTIYQKGMEVNRFGEFLKLDTQGSEHDILQGAKKMLKDRCLAIWCEVEFFEIYKNQKTFTDIDAMLRKFGFCIYGLYPHFRSTKALDRSQHKTEERIMWADAFFVKDPLDPVNKKKVFTERDIRVLILIAMACGFFDYAMELNGIFIKDYVERRRIESFIRSKSKFDQDLMFREVKHLYNNCRKRRRNSGMLLSQFVSKHRSNSDVDYLI